MKRISFFLMLLALTLTACGAASYASEPSPLAGGAGYNDNYAEPMAVSAPAADQKADNRAGEATQGQRLVIQNADLTVVVSDPKAKIDMIVAMAEGMGGFVVTSRVYETRLNSQKVPEGEVTVRVPAGNLNDALKQIKADALEVQNENRSGQDVTDQYTDLKSRLKNYEAAERELTRLLDKAERTEDVVQIFQQLQYYREQIELTRGQMEYFEQSAALSAITVRVRAEETIQPIEIAGWKPEGVARDAIQDLINFLQGVGTFLIQFFLYGLWVLLIIGAMIAIPIWIFVLIVRAIIRRMSKPKVSAPIVEEQKKG